MAKLKNPSKTQQIKMLDRRWSAFVRSHGRCEHCGTTESLTDSHIIGRTYLKTRFDPRNNQCVCAPCHGTFESQPLMFARWVESTTCGEHVDSMTIQANSIAKPDYDLWFKVYEITIERGYSLEECRQWLGSTILMTSFDLMKLE